MNAANDEQEVYQSQADRRAKQQYRRRVAIGQITVIVIVIAAWHLGSGRLFDPFYVGSPIGVAKVLVDDFGDPRFWNDLRVTGTEMILGYLVGGLSGIALGILFARWRLAADIFDPFFTGLNSLPRIALAPLLVIWFGIDMASKVVLAATLVFFLTFFTTLSGIRNVRPSPGRRCSVDGRERPADFSLCDAAGRSRLDYQRAENEFALRVDRGNRRRIPDRVQWARLPLKFVQHVL